MVLLVLASCGAHGGPAVPLPVAPPISLASIPPALAAGEQTTWQVFFRNINIGRVELAIDPHQARTTFRTGVLASALSSIHYELVTALDHGRVVGTTETLTKDGRTNRSDVIVDGAMFIPKQGVPQRVPGGTQLHTLQSALGVLRTWSRKDPRPGYLWVIHQGRLFRLDVFRPSRDEVLGIRSLRVEGIVRALDGAPAITMTLWLAANRDRTPVRFLIDGVSAEVLESTASFESR